MDDFKERIKVSSEIYGQLQRLGVFVIDKNRVKFAKASNSWIRDGCSGDVKLRLDDHHLVEIQFRRDGKSGVILKET